MSRTKKSNAQRVHSVGALMRGRDFTGSFEIDETAYNLVYSPTRALISGRRLQLIGRVTMTAQGNGRDSSKTQAGVRATLVGTQGGIGTAPTRRKTPSDVYQPATGLPPVDSSGALSFAGVLYLHLEPLQGSAYGVKADLTRLQVNARLLPLNDLERSLQAVYSSIADASFAEQPNQSAIADAIGELNRLLST
jgi:hypothetical protein